MAVKELDRLSERLTRMASNKFGPEDPAWYQFVMDHKQYLISKSSIAEFTILKMSPYKFKPAEFYVKECKGNFNQAWIFCMINDITDVTEFNESRTKLLIVSPDEIVKLRSLFDSASK